jgi:hypothetical protein
MYWEGFLEDLENQNWTIPAQKDNIQSETAFRFLPSPWGHRERTHRRSPRTMLFAGQELREIVSRSSKEIELRSEHGRCCLMLSIAEALALDLELFIGIGNRRRIRFLRPRTQKHTINSGSKTTQRVKNDAGANFAHPLIREHKPRFLGSR